MTFAYFGPPEHSILFQNLQKPTYYPLESPRDFTRTSDERSTSRAAVDDDQLRMPPRRRMEISDITHPSPSPTELQGSSLGLASPRSRLNLPPLAFSHGTASPSTATESSLAQSPMWHHRTTSLSPRIASANDEPLDSIETASNSPSHATTSMVQPLMVTRRSASPALFGQNESFNRRAGSPAISHMSALSPAAKMEPLSPVDSSSSHSSLSRSIHRDINPSSSSTMGPSTSSSGKRDGEFVKEYPGQWANATGTRTGLTPSKMIDVDAPTKVKRESYKQRAKRGGAGGASSALAAGGSYAAPSTPAAKLARRAAAAAANTKAPASVTSSHESTEEDDEIDADGDGDYDPEKDVGGGGGGGQRVLSNGHGAVSNVDASSLLMQATVPIQIQLPRAVVESLTQTQREQYLFKDGLPLTLRDEQKALLKDPSSGGSAALYQEWQTAVKRRKNTVAARTTRRRKLENQKDLEVKVADLEREVREMRDSLHKAQQERDIEERKCANRVKQIGQLECLVLDSATPGVSRKDLEDRMRDLDRQFGCLPN